MIAIVVAGVVDSPFLLIAVDNCKSTEPVRPYNERSKQRMFQNCTTKHYDVKRVVLAVYI